MTELEVSLSPLVNPQALEGRGSKEEFEWFNFPKAQKNFLLGGVVMATFAPYSGAWCRVLVWKPTEATKQLLIGQQYFGASNSYKVRNMYLVKNCSMDKICAQLGQFFCSWLTVPIHLKQSGFELKSWVFNNVLQVFLNVQNFGEKKLTPKHLWKRKCFPHCWMWCLGRRLQGLPWRCGVLGDLYLCSLDDSSAFCWLPKNCK